MQTTYIVKLWRLGSAIIETVQQTTIANEVADIAETAKRFPGWHLLVLQVDGYLQCAIVTPSEVESEWMERQPQRRQPSTENSTGLNLPHGCSMSASGCKRKAQSRRKSQVNTRVAAEPLVEPAT